MLKAKHIIRIYRMNLIEIRRTLHQHPELGFEEQWTAGFLARHLKAMGLEVTGHIAKTGIVAVLRGERSDLPAIGYRADMDALPITELTDVSFASQNGCMHACGHDSHMTVALGVAEKLSLRPTRPQRNIAFVFQPNEEGAPGEMPSGAELMVREGILEKFNIQSMIALHSDPTLDTGIMGICRGTIWAASGRFRVTIRGNAAHAAYPYKGRDALWAATETVNAMYAALARMRPATPEVVSICKLKAGNAFNVVADYAEFEGIIRAPSRSTLDEIADLLTNVANGIAQSCGVESTFERFYGANAVKNNDTLVDIAQQVWTKTGVARTIPMNMASEDFSHFADRIPCFYAMMGIKPEGQEIPPSHSDHFWLDENALEPAVNHMIALIDALM